MMRLEKMKLVYLLLVLTTLYACDKQKDGVLLLVSDPGRDAESVFLTHDQNQNPVVVWVERDTVAHRHHFYYAISTDAGRTFPNKINVPIPDQITTHAEGMPKVAFKKDGTVIAAYEKSAPTKENKWAGAIYYLYSSDEGKTWSASNFLHSDTVTGRSRGFFDMTTLPDGEVGASWLDIKNDFSEKGRSIRFAKTNGGTAFGNEVVIDPYACECCRTDLYADAMGNINVAYRSVRKGSFDQLIRDMVWVMSSDGGKSFSSPAPISNDKWILNGCPHSGPTLAATNSAGLHALWYTEGNGKGVYYSVARPTEGFSSRELISNGAKYPQLASNENSVFMVWSEQKDDATIIAYQWRKDPAPESGYATPDSTQGYYPVVVSVGRNNFLVSYIGQDAVRKIYLKRF